MVDLLPWITFEQCWDRFGLDFQKVEPIPSLLSKPMLFPNNGIINDKSAQCSMLIEYLSIKPLSRMNRYQTMVFEKQRKSQP